MTESVRPILAKQSHSKVRVTALEIGKLPSGRSALEATDALPKNSFLCRSNGLVFSI